MMSFGEGVTRCSIEWRPMRDHSVSAHDVASYIVRKRGPMTAMKLQKLVYYAQAWHLVWERVPLFRETVEAWAQGPVVRELYREHRGRFTIQSWRHGNPERLTRSQAAVVDSVLDYYGDKSADWLSSVTHEERPWKDARRNLSEGAPGQREITHAAMIEYYGGLIANPEARA